MRAGSLLALSEQPFARGSPSAKRNGERPSPGLFGTSLSDPQADHPPNQRAQALGGVEPGRAPRGVATWGKSSGAAWGAGRPARQLPGRRRRRRERPAQQRVKGRGRGLSRVIGQIMCSKQKVCVCVPVSHCIGPICTTLSSLSSPYSPWFFSLRLSISPPFRQSLLDSNTNTSRHGNTLIQ